MIRINEKITRTFNSESYGKLLAEYQPKTITTRTSYQTSTKLRTSSQSYSRKGDAVGTVGDIN